MLARPSGASVERLLRRRCRSRAPHPLGGCRRRRDSRARQQLPTSRRQWTPQVR